MEFCILDEPFRNFPRGNIEYIRELGKGWFGQVCMSHDRITQIAVNAVGLSQGINLNLFSFVGDRRRSTRHCPICKENESRCKSITRGCQ